MECTEYLTWVQLIVVPIAVVLVTAFATFIFSKKLLEPVNNAGIDKLKYEAILKSNESFWRLIAYTTEVGNKYSIITWEREDKKDTYFFNPQNYERFLDDLRKCFYDEGNGIYISEAATSLLFENRNVLYGVNLLLKNPSEKTVLNNVEMVKSIFKRTNELRSEIRKNIELDQRKLELKK